jgi:hypothetical protein
MTHQVDRAVQKHPPEVRRLAFSEQFDTGLDSNLLAPCDQLGQLIVGKAREQAERSKLIDVRHNVTI